MRAPGGVLRGSREGSLESVIESPLEGRCDSTLGIFTKLLCKVKPGGDAYRLREQDVNSGHTSITTTDAIEHLFFEVLPQDQRTAELYLLLLTRFGESPLRRPQDDQHHQGLDTRLWQSLSRQHPNYAYSSTAFLARFASHAFHGSAQRTLEDLGFMQDEGMMHELRDLPQELLAYAGKAFTSAAGKHKSASKGYGKDRGR